MEENIMLIVSDETYDRTAAESVRPSSENRHKPARSGEMLKSVVARVWRERERGSVSQSPRPKTV
jgi:hypothetical protein